MPHHVTPDDVIDLKLSIYDACVAVNVCVKLITKNFTTDIFKKSICYVSASLCLIKTRPMPSFSACIFSHN